MSPPSPDRTRSSAAGSRPCTRVCTPRSSPAVLPPSPGREETRGAGAKPLPPRLHAAILARRGDPEHDATLAAEEIEPIDLVCVNLYPFEETVSGHEVDHDVAIENIDIGGP